ncbi:hypothetical protein ACVLV4_000271 [Rathayibacter agropyri]
MNIGDVIALVVGLAAAVAAVWAVVVAHRANARADAANALAAQSNGLAEEANVIAARALKMQEQALPAVWSAAERGEKSVMNVRNQSGRRIVVTAIEAIPIEMSGLLHLMQKFPQRVEHGDRLEFSVPRRMVSGVEAVRLEWRFEDDDLPQQTERRV